MNEPKKYITDVVYLIYEMTREGHLKHPLDIHDEPIFNTYGGYSSMQEAQNAILEYVVSNHGMCKPYLVLPMVNVLEDITDQEL